MFSVTARPAASFNGTARSCAQTYSAEPSIMRIANGRFLMVASSNDRDRGLAHDVVVIPGRIEDQRVHLRLPDAIGRLGQDPPRTRGVGGKAIAERTECEAARIGAERRFAPACSCVGRNFDAGNAVAAVPGDAS